MIICCHLCQMRINKVQIRMEYMKNIKNHSIENIVPSYTLSVSKGMTAA